MSETSQETISQNGLKDLESGKKITLSAMVKNTIEVARYVKQAKEEDRIYPAGAVSLVGIKAVFPERFEGKSLAERDDVLFFSHLVILGVAVNDVVDIIPVMREAGGQQSTIEKTFKLWKKVHSLVSGQIDADPQKTSERNDLVQSYQREVLFLEREARLHSAEWPLEEVIRYRELVNAVGLVHSAAAILPYPDIGTHARAIPKQELSVDSLAKKYKWLTANNPQTEAERRLATLFNLAMTTQVIDDWYDVEGDRKLKLTTIGTIIDSTSTNHNQGEKRIKELRNNYLKRAIDNNSTKIASMGVVHFMVLLKECQKRWPKMFGGIRENLPQSEAFFAESAP